jgi:hypothetical protein
MQKRITKEKLYSKRGKGSNLMKMMVKEWKGKMRDREQWRLAVDEAKAHPGL